MWVHVGGSRQWDRMSPVEHGTQGEQCSCYRFRSEDVLSGSGNADQSSRILMELCSGIA